MRRPLPLLALVVVVTAAALLLRRGWLADGDLTGTPRASITPRAVASPSAAPSPLAQTPSSRDPFRYGDEPVASVALASPQTGPFTSAVPTEPAVRLVGWLRRGSQLKAALALIGEVVVLGEGESAHGYLVLSMDEDSGVRLRDPAGREIDLPPPD